MPPKRRQYGSGSVYQRGDGRWIGILQTGWTETGKRATATVSATTRAECVRRLEKRRAELDTFGIVRTSVTVKAWADEWLSRQEDRVAPKTYLGYRTNTRKWIIPAIGKAKLADLSPDHVRILERRVAANGNSSTTVRQARIVLGKMLHDAERDGYSIPRPTMLVELPALAPTDKAAIPVADCLKLLTVARDQPDYARWILALLYGLRQGEALGLEWDRIDQDAIDISWSLQSIPYRVPRDPTSGHRIPKGFEIRPVLGTWCLKRPKSQAGWRIATTLPALLAALPPRSTGLVFTDNGGPVDPKDDSAAWRLLQRRAKVQHPGGRPYTVHEARHSTATLLMALGIPDDVRIKLMGHSSIETTSRYSHADLSHVRAALEKSAAVLELD